MGIAEYMLDHPKYKNDHIAQVKKGAKFLQKELTNLGIKWFGGNYTNGILIFLKNTDSKPIRVLKKNPSRSLKNRSFQIAKFSFFSCTRR